MKFDRFRLIRLGLLILSLAIAPSHHAATLLATFDAQVGSNTPPSLSFIIPTNIVLAANLGGTNLVRDGISFTGISATGANPMTNTIGDYTLRMSAPGGGLSSATYGDALYGSFIWAGVQSPQTLTVTGLDTNKEYNVFYLAGDNRLMTFDMTLAVTAATGVNSRSVTNSSFRWGGQIGLSNYVYLPVYVSGATSLTAVMSKNDGSAGTAFSGIIIETVASAPPMTIVDTLSSEESDALIVVGPGTLRSAQFTTDDAYYSLHSVSLKFSHTPNWNDPIRISLYNDNSGMPGNEVVEFSGETTPSGGTFVYSPLSSFTLQPTTSYHIVATVPLGSGEYRWSAVSRSVSLNGTIITNGPGQAEIAREFSSDAGASWIHSGIGQDVMLYSVTGTKLPSLKAIGLTGQGYQLQFAGGSGRVILQSSSDLNTWTSLLTNTISANPITFTDTNALGMTPQFYRLVK